MALKQKIKGFWWRIKNYVYLFFNIWLAITLYQKFGSKGVWGLLLAISLILFIRGWRARKLFIYELGKMETQIFGKPLSKKNWEKGELKQIKLKPKWKSEKTKNKRK